MKADELVVLTGRAASDLGYRGHQADNVSREKGM